MQLTIDIGKQQIKAGLFEEGKLVHTVAGPSIERLQSFLQGRTIHQCLISSINASFSKEIASLLTSQSIPFRFVQTADFQRLGTEETCLLLQPDRIANIYGALYHFPLNDCIVADLATDIHCDLISKEGVYLGGAIFSYSKEAFPTGEDAPRIVGKTAMNQAKSGAYYGILGAVERMVSELRLSSRSPTTVMAIGTGELTLFPNFQRELRDFMDGVDPYLSLIGLYQLLQEVNP